MIWLAVLLSAAAAGVIQSITGFGAAVMMMLVIPYFFDMLRAPALVSAICLGLAVLLAWKFRRAADWRLTLPLGLSYIAVSTIVIALAGSLDLELLSAAFGVFLICLSVYYLRFARRASVRPTLTSALVCGAAAGVTGGLFGIGGPIAAIYFLSAADTKELYVANLQLLFVLTNLANLITRSIRGIYTLDLVPLTLVGILGVNLGKWAGLKVLDRLDIERMKLIVYIFIGVSGAITLAGHI